MTVLKLKEFDQVGRLTLLQKFRVRLKTYSVTKWYCICECGNTSFQAGVGRSGGALSCGCLQRETAAKMAAKAASNNRKYPEGCRSTVLFKRWTGMMYRCHYIGDDKKAYKCYRGKGISVCDSWHDFNNFKIWAENSGYDPALTIDRIDSKQGYCPENCQWISMSDNLKKRDIYKGSRPWQIGNKHRLKKS